MPPRAAPRARAPPPPKKQKINPTPAPPEPTLPIPYSAAREVYSIAELRQRILGLLGKSDLKKCLRVGEEMMCDVVKVIYRSIDYERVVAIQTVPAARQRVYASAVTEVHATEDNIPRELFIQAGGTFSRYKRRQPLEKYHPKMCKAMSDALRARFPHLRKVYYGRDHGRQSWNLDFQIDTSPNPPANAGASLIGHVQVLNRIDLYLPCSPFTAMQVQARPARGYSMSQRFNLVLDHDGDGESTSPALTSAWLTSLRTDPMYGDLYKILDLGDLPIAIDDITSIIKRQLDVSHAERLQRIVASFVLSFSTAQFIRFSDLAGSSVTVLYLADQYVAERHQNGIAFSDLGALISIIQDHLPHLENLRMAISGVETAETMCRDLLSADVGPPRGKLSELRLFTPHHGIPLFNVIRCLAPLCAEGVTLSVGNHRYTNDQTNFLQYILRQSHDHRTHLNTVDFSSIGVGVLREVHQLEYSTSGRPLSRTVTKASIALRYLRAAGTDNKSVILVNVDKVVMSCQMMVDRLESISSKATTPGFIGEAEDLVKAIQQAQDEMARARNRLNLLERVIQPVAQSVADLICAHKAMEAGGY